MLKREEEATPSSCWNRAADDEAVFVLLGRDVAMPATLRAWVGARISLEKNLPGDPQLVEAEQLADRLELMHQASGKLP